MATENKRGWKGELAKYSFTKMIEKGVVTRPVHEL